MPKTPAPIRAVLFDFDGTLADTTALILESLHHTTRTHLGRAWDDAFWLAEFGNSLAGQMARVAPDQAEAMVETYRAYMLDRHDALVRLYPGVAEMLAALRALDVRIGLVSSKSRRGVERGLALFALAGHFGCAVCLEDVTRPKPHPEPILAALDRLGQPPTAALYVGDSRADLEAGRKAGVRTALAGWGPHPAHGRAGHDYLADYDLAEPADVAAVVKTSQLAQVRGAAPDAAAATDS